MTGEFAAIERLRLPAAGRPRRRGLDRRRRRCPRPPAGPAAADHRRVGRRRPRRPGADRPRRPGLAGLRRRRERRGGHGGRDPTGRWWRSPGRPTTDLDLLYEGIAAASAGPRVPGRGRGPVQLERAGGGGGGHRARAREIPGRCSAAAPGPGTSSCHRSARRRGRRASGPGAHSHRGTGAGRRASAGSGAGPGEMAALETAHRRPRARLAEGEAARLAGATAMIDVSDGLLADLGHVADASGVGFRLDRVPVSPGATTEEALGGGEDYELVVATPHPEALVAAFADGRAAAARPHGVVHRRPDRAHPGGRARPDARDGNTPGDERAAGRDAARLGFGTWPFTAVTEGTRDIPEGWDRSPRDSPVSQGQVART